ncbi:amidohydrolase family protein [Desulfosporosinus sp. SB140]|uniref:N-acyl-D-amino-acid deacylase family protein n=1 Tax=Desulfosporosinus paludis TaxID=3115649 RepID=UPI00388FFD73
MDCDLLIINGFIIDGTGKPGFYADLAISKGKIMGVASKLECTAGRIIDAFGLVVSPGFIDPHVHAELAVLTSGAFEDYLRQGVTTTINGNCGHSITPYSSDNIYRYMTTSGLISPEEEERYKRSVPAWNSFSSYIDTIKSRSTNLNMGFLLGHGSLRWSVMGKTNARTPNVEEYKELSRLIEEGMEQGALGLSTGLAYRPSKHAATDELIQLAKITQKYDGIYTSHLRTYLGILEAVKEAIQIGEAADIRVQISHLTPSCPEAFVEILTARNRGLEIAVDTIPKSSGHFKRWDRFLQFMLPSISQTYELNRNVLQDTDSAHKINRKLLKKIRFKDNLMVFHTADPEMERRTLKGIADEKRTAVDDLILQLLANNNPKLTFCQGGLNRWDFPGTPYPDDVAHNPLVMVGSDRIFGNLHDPYDWYELFRKGAFPIYFDLCKQKGLSLEEVIRRVTSFPAQQFRLKGRGVLAKGNAADIVILDPDHFRYPTNEEIDPLNPRTMASGVRYTIVNGNVVLDNGIVKEINAGQLLSRNGTIL